MTAPQLGSGERRKKYDLRVAAYGTLDEVNAVIGLVRLHTADDRPLDAVLAASRTTCSTSRPTSASPEGKGPGGARLTVTEAQVEWLEQEIDRLNAELAPLRSFVLPGGRPAAAYLHLARTICRRAERIMVELKDSPTRPCAAALPNTSTACPISCSSRAAMQRQGRRDVLWEPGENRTIRRRSASQFIPLHDTIPSHGAHRAPYRHPRDHRRRR